VGVTRLEVASFDNAKNLVKEGIIKVAFMHFVPSLEQ